MSSGPRNKLVVKSQQHKMKGRKPKQMVLLISILDTITDSENSSSSSVVESALSGMDLKEKVKYGFVEGLLNEVVNGLLQSDVMASPFPMHTMLMDLSMCAWTTWQNYQLSRELMTDEAVTACSLPSVAISGTPLNGAEGSLSADTKLSTESTGRSLLQYALMTLLVNVVSHELLPMALHAAEGAVEGLLNEVVNGLLQSDVMASPFPMHTMLMDLSMCAWTTWQNYQLSRELMTDEAVTACSLPSVAISGAPLNGAGEGLTAVTRLSTESTGRSLLQYALMTLLVNVVSHELLPMALHAAEGAVQQLIVASLIRNE
eukprot:CAMPEP_0201113082 /NCGR_PEP_ID=MMETSP0812-20130820/77633_1 /ASSEMBLY_ACC=CAM_ASM_000668 /TAXON_ID=98059 /ORGANISM="Dinobryon sp., Strain UTEXLB2267" /LENGTH=316 /DNA_ID=CAMNT_0047376549 /DNA_START=138 /DNA_END=1088 /DNA_ORIENTATION=-